MRRSWRRAAPLLATALVVGTACSGSGSEGPAPLPAWPATIAGIGDSITTAAVPDREHLSADNPELSWVTGGAEVDGHRARVAAHDVAVTAADVAVAGARIADAPAQAERAVAAGADYVTFLLGANDVCASDPPSPEVFGAGVRDALGRLESGLSDAHVLVVSIPDVVHLREVFAGDVRATATWQRTGACPAVLAGQPTEDVLVAVRARQAAYDAELRAACAEHPRCVDDGGAVAAHRFGADEVSDVDYFHPSVAGQRRLAALTWDAMFGR
ncbi:MAG: SGNH/GDSL hydrolase family protein [Actinobacteria bacterium]|nr:SGNH/GDSL hydrolase family protein [Actinomycetota bacterium]